MFNPAKTIGSHLFFPLLAIFLPRIQVVFELNDPSLYFQLLLRRSSLGFVSGSEDGERGAERESVYQDPWPDLQAREPERPSSTNLQPAEHADRRVVA